MGIGLNLKVVRAIAGRDFSSSLANPSGYVFLTLFIGLTGAAAFLQQGFFVRNLADLSGLNAYMPLILMLFVPALTMGSWAEERRQGTDELLLTLPVSDVEVVLGKYFGALGVYTVALGLSLSHVLVLAYLGDPDLGLLAATYLGYWLTGAAFVAVALLASILSQNLTMAFVLGVLACAGLVFANSAVWAAGVFGSALIAAVCAMTWWVLRGQPKGVGFAAALGFVAALGAWLAWLGDSFTGLFASFDAGMHARSFGEGLVQLGDVSYFAALAVVVLYACTFVLGRRHW